MVQKKWGEYNHLIITIRDSQKKKKKIITIRNGDK